jgi:hypothetical protein
MARSIKYYVSIDHIGDMLNTTTYSKLKSEPENTTTHKNTHDKKSKKSQSHHKKGLTRLSSPIVEAAPCPGYTT